MIILQKFIADSGHCSRRKAEELIRQGKVTVNSRPAELGMKVGNSDEVKIYGKKISVEKEKIYIKLFKPSGYTCTARKFKGEKNIFDLVKADKRLFAVGRLDKESRGLILLTNDGDLSQKLTHPRYGHEKEYEVIVDCRLSIAEFNNIPSRFKKGIDIGEGDGLVKVRDIEYLQGKKFKVILTGGKKRQLRRMFKIMGCEVADLLRVRIKNLNLEGIKEGEWSYLSEDEIKNLKTNI